MVEHNGECKPFDFCPSLYGSTPETASTATGPICNGRIDAALKLSQPEYLSIPNWQDCTGIKWAQDCSASFHCRPAEKPGHVSKKAGIY